MPLFVRLSAVDFAPGGLELADIAAVARWSRDVGADLFDVSAGGIVAHQHIDPQPGYQVPFAAEIRGATGALTAAVGLITTGRQAEQILRDGDADAVLVGREFLRDPHFALRAATELGESPEQLWPRQHRRVRPLPVLHVG